jgi:hypothetical protein
MTPVGFGGLAPFALPVVQSGEAVALDENVEMTLWVLVDGVLTAVHAQIAQRKADEFGTALLQAAAAAHANRMRG